MRRSGLQPGVLAVFTLMCAACVTAEPLSVGALRTAIQEQAQAAPYEHDLEADLAWIRAMPVLQRLATDIVNLDARFIAVGGDRWSVPGVPPRLYCLIGPASMRPMPISPSPATEVERALGAQVESFIAPYNRLLAEYYEAEYGWDCEETSAEGAQSKP